MEADENRAKGMAACISETRVGKPEIIESIIVEGRGDYAAVLAAVSADIIVTHGFKIRHSAKERIISAAAGRGAIVFTDPDHAGENIRRRITEFVGATAGVLKHARIVREDALCAGDVGVENASAEVILSALVKAGATFRGSAPCGDRAVWCGNDKTTWRTDVRAARHADDKLARYAENEAAGRATDKSAGDPWSESALRGYESKRSDESKCGGLKNSGESGHGGGSESGGLGAAITERDMMRLGLVGAGSKKARVRVGRALGIGYANAKQFLHRLRATGTTLAQLEELLL